MSDDFKESVPVKAPAAKAAPAAGSFVPVVNKAKPVPAKAAPVPVNKAQPAARPLPVATPAPSPQPIAMQAAPIETPPSQITPAPAPIAETIQKGPTMTDTVTNTTDAAKTFAQDAQSKATEVFGDMNSRAKSAMERSGKIVEDMNEFNKGNIEAFVESSKVAAKAAEQMGQQAAEAARKNFESATAAMKSFASVKTPTEFFQLQSEYVRSAFDSMMTDTSKNSEAMLKLASDVFQPISNRLAVAAEKMKIAA